MAQFRYTIDNIEYDPDTGDSENYPEEADEEKIEVDDEEFIDLRRDRIVQSVE